jgi:hypothetical protein
MALTTLIFSLVYGTVIVRVDELFELESDMWKKYTFLE